MDRDAREFKYSTGSRGSEMPKGFPDGALRARLSVISGAACPERDVIHDIMREERS